MFLYMNYLLMKNFLNIKTPTNILLWWNFGSLISIFMFIQILMGFSLSMNYFTINNLFISSFNIFFNLNYGWLIRNIHNNLTSFIFIIILIHLKRTLFFKSYYLMKMWMSGFIMLLLFMLESFLGYSLICNQMSYWAMMVITNFISSIPLMGNILVKWIWGNFNINIILINRFFSLHFIIPFIIIIFIFIHLMILHMNKSNNPLGINNKIDLIKLNPLSLIKDKMMFLLMLIIFINLILLYPFNFNNNDNFLMMNYFKTPIHIEPEWYFLFFYSILRSINNKFNGLLMLIISIIMIMLIPFINLNKFQSFNFIYKINMLMILNIIIIISLLGKKNIEFPYMNLNKTLILMYFIMYLLMFISNSYWNKMY